MRHRATTLSALIAAGFGLAVAAGCGQQEEEPADGLQNQAQDAAEEAGEALDEAAEEGAEAAEEAADELEEKTDEMREQAEESSPGGGG